MNKKTKSFLLVFFLIVAIAFLSIYGLSMAKSVLGPIFLAILVAMLLARVSSFLEKKGWKRGWAAFASDFIFVIFICGILLAVGAEAKRITSNASSIQNQLSNVFSNIDSFVENKFGYNLENPFSNIKNNKNTASISPSEVTANPQNTLISAGSIGNLQNYIKNILTWTFSSITNLLLIVVYIFFMLLHRDKFEKGVLYFVPEEKRDKASRTISEILENAQQYLWGHVILISLLTGFYTIGFSIAGIGGPFTTALLASVLTLVPYVGTMIGNLLALAVAFITTDSMSAVWIVLATVSIGQFIESYLLEPYVVGKRMDVNPLFTILSVTIGAAIWGIWGMIIFLPLFSFIKVIADKISFLRPIGYFIGKEDTQN